MERSFKESLRLDDTTFGAWVQRRRKALGLTQTELAGRVNCSVALIRKIEQGERHPSRQIAEVLANVLQIEPKQREIFLQVARGQRPIERLAPADPPAGSPPSLPAESYLPTPLTPLVGRRHELDMILKLLQNSDCRLLTLTGPGGIGKTRLAVAAATTLRKVLPVVFVPLAPILSPRFMVPAIAKAIDLILDQPIEPRQQLLQYLTQQSMLLVLDNLEHVLDGADLLTQILEAAPRVKLLVTSRQPVNLLGEWVFEVGGLPVPPDGADFDSSAYEASALFVQTARRVHPGLDLAAADWVAIGRICRMVEGMPLAIELAASWVPVLSCPEIAVEIARALDFLVTPLRDVPDRHRSLRAVFDHSWNLLSPTEQQALARLAVFQSGFRREAAVEVAEATLPLLRSLTNWSLVRQQSAGRYDLHPVVRQFAAEHLQADPNNWTLTRERHSSYYARFLQERQPSLFTAQQREAGQEILIEIDNLRLAWDWICDHIHWADLQRSMVSLRQVHNLFALRYEGLEMFSRAVQAIEDAIAAGTAPEGNSEQILAEALANQGWFAYNCEQYAWARQLLERAIAILRRYGSPWAPLAFALTALGTLLAFTGEPQLAMTFLEEAIRLWSSLEDQSGMADALTTLGVATMQQGQYATAKDRLETGLALWRMLGLVQGELQALTYLGVNAMRQGEYAQAEQHLREAIALSPHPGDTITRSAAYYYLARLTHLQGRDAEARQYSLEGQAMWQSTRSVRAETLDSTLLALILFRLGDRLQVVELLRRAERLSQEGGDRWALTWVYLNWGMIARWQGEYAEAERWLRRSLDMGGSTGDTSIRLQILNNLADTRQAQGDVVEAQRLYLSALRQALETQTTPAAVQAVTGLVELQAAQGQLEQALTALDPILVHPAADYEIRERVQGLHQQVQESLSLDAVSAATAQDQSRSFEEVARELIRLYETGRLHTCTTVN